MTEYVRIRGKNQDSKCRKICGVLVLLAVVIVIAVSVTLMVILSNHHFSTEKKEKFIVTTNVGSFEGFKEVFDNNKESYKFKGIPFAEPPVENLRWKPPVPKRKLEDLYVANKSNTLCIQFVPPPFPPIEREPSEDCLYLHVHTPTLDKKANLPVFVWIHGGYLMNAYADMIGYYPDGEFAADMNIVTVSLSYRLNAFGYLTLKELWNNGTSYGNYGLLDQILGLKWVKDNIRNFGGDPNLITISGQSSGGTSVYALAASPLANGLFQRGIPMSGSPSFPRNFSQASADNRVFIENTKCRNLTHHTTIKDCLYNLTPKEIVASIPVDTYPEWAMLDLLDFPTWKRIIGSVLVLDPISLPVAPKDVSTLKELNTDIDIMIGTTAQEAGLAPLRIFNKTSELEQFLDERLKPFQTITYRKISNIYKNFSTYVKTNVSAQFLFETIVTDARVACATNQLVKDFRKSPFYENTFRYISAWKAVGVVDKLIPFHDAAHLTDAIALFGFKWWVNDTAKLTASERQFMTTIRQVFKKFMVEGKVDGAKPGETIVFNGDGNVENIVGDYHKEQCEMWSEPENGFLPYVWIN